MAAALVLAAAASGSLSLAASAMLWTRGMFVESRSFWADAVGTDPRLGDDVFLRVAMRWPPKAIELAANVRGSALDALSAGDDGAIQAVSSPLPTVSGGAGGAKGANDGERDIAWDELSSRCAEVREWVGVRDI